MNHLLEKHCLLVCFFCNKAFRNHQALRSHLMFHQEAMMSGNDSSIDINAPNVSSIPQNQSSIDSVFNGAASSCPLSKRVCSRSFSENNLRDLNTRFIMSPNLSSGYVNVELNYPPCFPSTSMPPLLFQYDIGEVQSCLGVMSFPSTSMPPLAVDYPYPAVGSNQPLFFKEPTTCGVDEAGEHNKSSTMKSEGKRPCLGDVQVDAEVKTVSKRPKIGSYLRVGKEKAGKKEMENPSSSVVKEEKEAALDLSLHL